MARKDYLDDPNAPKANSLIPAASAIVTNEEGKLLLHKRSDNSLWGLPGGAMEVGESIGETIMREVKEETGLEVIPEYITGIYTNPHHVIAFSNGEVRQEFSICFACRIISGKLQVSQESFEVAFFAPYELEQLDIHPANRLRIQHYLEHKALPIIQ
ncbi:MAG: NUDIX domain-containing protein [Ktedonobacteraceae bacterium]